jgi:hypothetical protein
MYRDYDKTQFGGYVVERVMGVELGSLFYGLIYDEDTEDLIWLTPAFISYGEARNELVAVLDFLDDPNTRYEADEWYKHFENIGVEMVKTSRFWAEESGHFWYRGNHFHNIGEFLTLHNWQNLPTADNEQWFKHLYHEWNTQEMVDYADVEF